MNLSSLAIQKKGENLGLLNGHVEVWVICQMDDLIFQMNLLLTSILKSWKLGLMIMF